MRAGQSRASFVDCAVHGAGSGAELFIVEGESAASSVAAVRSARFQAVLPLQGKPLNAWRATAEKVRAHALYAQLAAALGIDHATALEHAAETELSKLRFERLVLLMDPDADGIHIGALTLLYMHRWAPALITAGRVEQARAPMFVLEAAGTAEGTTPSMAYTPAQCQTLIAKLTAEHGAPPRVQSVRGLGSLAPQWLGDHCVGPATRRNRVVSADDVRAVIEVFGSLG
jgi:DNA gyrase subunit B